MTDAALQQTPPSPAQTSKSWPHEQARILLKRIGDKRDEVVFQTGYGPSGAPHIGTFCEVVRTQMVRNAFIDLTNNEIPTRLVVFSDDYDGFRAVPEGLPEEMRLDIGLPLTSVRDPFGSMASFADRNNKALQQFLNELEFDYEFISATKFYKSGRMDDVLRAVHDNYEAVQAIMLPTLGEDRRATYSPFLPISPKTGHVLTDANVRLHENHTISFNDEDGLRHLIDVTGGNVKLQWKVDWASRWMALGVNYEMHGKDLLESASLSTKICRALSRPAPVTYFYELFLDDQGRKISKKLGNGFTIEQWLSFAPIETLTFFMYQAPRVAKTLSHTVVPRIADDYLKARLSYMTTPAEKRRDSAIWHVFGGMAPNFTSDVTYGLMVNLATVSGAKDGQTLMRYLRQYKELSVNDSAVLWDFIDPVLNYTRKHVLLNRQTRLPSNSMEREALLDMADRLEAFDVSTVEPNALPEAFQAIVYQVGKDHGFDPLRSWFLTIYQVLFGSDEGPRFGSFTAAFGRKDTVELLRKCV